MTGLMSIDKNKICNILRKMYPKAFGIRKRLQRKKIARLYRYILPEDKIRECEMFPERKAEVIKPYVNKWKRMLKPVIREMETVTSNSPAFKDSANLDEIRTDMLFCRLAYGFLPSEYAGFHFENRSIEERKQFASDLDTNVFGYSVNDISEIQGFIDKGAGYELVKQYYKRDAVVIENKRDYPEFLAFVNKHPIFVKKKVFSSMGRGVELIDADAYGSNREQLFFQIIREGKHLLEERVIQHESLAKVNSSSVNTVRCITLNTVDGIIVPYCFFKAGRNGAFVDNAGAGGIVVGVEPACGKCFTDGFTEYGERYEMHPESGVVFKDISMPDWAELVAVCKEISGLFPNMKYLSYDLAYTDQGWVLIEVNEVGQFIIPQIVQQRGIKGELTQFLKRINKCV